eukprot:1171825-Pyramimonas_sp.AAC.1
MHRSSPIFPIHTPYRIPSTWIWMQYDLPESFQTSSASWDLWMAPEIAGIEGVRTVLGDQCPYGL